MKVEIVYVCTNTGFPVKKKAASFAKVKQTHSELEVLCHG